MPRQRASTEQVLGQLRADILGGVFAPGQKLKFADLGQRYGASVSAIRECLTRLTEQRLVVSEPMVGFRVMPLTAADLCDLTDTRIDLEVLALRGAIESGGVEWESELVAAHHRLERTPMTAPDEPRKMSEEWEQAHTAFHAALLAGCRRPRLLEMTASLRDATRLYRRWAVQRHPQRDGIDEHRAILEAALAGDAETATAALRRHYERTAEILSQGLSSPLPHPEG